MLIILFIVYQRKVFVIQCVMYDDVAIQYVHLYFQNTLFRLEKLKYPQMDQSKIIQREHVSNILVSKYNHMM